MSFADGGQVGWRQSGKRIEEGLGSFKGWAIKSIGQDFKRDPMLVVVAFLGCAYFAYIASLVLMFIASVVYQYFS